MGRTQWHLGHGLRTQQGIRSAGTALLVVARRHDSLYNAVPCGDRGNRCVRDLRECGSGNSSAPRRGSGAGDGMACACARSAFVFCDPVPLRAQPARSGMAMEHARGSLRAFAVDRRDGWRSVLLRVCYGLLDRVRAIEWGGDLSDVAVHHRRRNPDRRGDEFRDQKGAGSASACAGGFRMRSGLREHRRGTNPAPRLRVLFRVYFV